MTPSPESIVGWLLENQDQVMDLEPQQPGQPNSLFRPWQQTINLHYRFFFINFFLFTHKWTNEHFMHCTIFPFLRIFLFKMERFKVIILLKIWIAEMQKRGKCLTLVYWLCSFKKRFPISTILADPVEEEEDYSDTESISESFEDIDASATSEGREQVVS